MFCLIIPALLMDHEKFKSSDIDNKTLTEWPGFSMDTETIKTIGDYIDDRIGFRTEAIYYYTKESNDLFHVMVHPLFMYGEDGHIYYKDSEYIKAYQRLNTDKEYMDSFVDFLDETNDYLEKRGVKFIYYMAPDKKTIYPEYFPKTIHVKEDEETVIDYMKSKLDETDISYVIPDEELKSAKKNEIVYNQKYDATHWNERGSFIGQSCIDTYLCNWFEDVKPLSEDDFILSYEKKTNLDQSDFPIDDDVPLYTLKSDTSQDASGYLAKEIELEVPTFYKHFLNPEVANGKRLIIFTDSYFATYSKFYTQRFSEVYYIHRQNYEYIQYFVNLLFPDVVIFETAERSITGEMPFLEEFDNYYYEEPYKSVCERGLTGAPLPDGLSYNITRFSGATVNGNKILIDPNGEESIVSICGTLSRYNKTKDYNIYFLIDGNYLEADYDALHKRSQSAMAKYFEVHIQRRYISPCEIQMMAVDKENGNEYILQTFEVSYVE